MTSTEPGGGSSASWVTGPAADAAAGAGAAAGLAGVGHADRDAPGGQAEPGGERRPKSWRCARTRPGTTTARLVMIASRWSRSRWRTSSASGRSPSAASRAAELPRGAARQLLHPAHPQPQRLAQHGGLVAALRRRTEDEGVGGGGQRRTAAPTLRRGPGRAPPGCARGSPRRSRPSSRASTSTRSAIDAPVIRVVSGVDEQPHQDLVRVQGAEHVPAAVQEREELPAGERRQLGHGAQVGVGAVEEVLGQVGEGGAAAGRPATRRAAGGRRHRVQALPAALGRSTSSPARRRSMPTCPRTVTTISLAATSRCEALPARRTACGEGLASAAAPTGPARAR